MPALNALGDTGVLDRRGQALDVRPLAVLIDRIRRQWTPLQIWLFGSRARGSATMTSDWDLLVVVPDDRSDEEVDDPIAGWRLQKDSGVYADVVACRRSDFEAARSTPNTLAYEVIANGVLLDER